MDKNLSFQKKDDVSIVLCGQAGQGIQTVEHLLTRIFKLAGYNVFATKEYMSRIRGGMNSTEIRVSSVPIHASVSRIDILIPLDKEAVKHVEKRISPQTIILADEETTSEDFDQNKYKFVEVPFTKTASKIGNKIYSNVVAVGTVAGLFRIELRTVSNFINQYFSTKSEDIVKNNLTAAKAGYELAENLQDFANQREYWYSLLNTQKNSA